MKKSVIAMLLALSLVVGLSACTLRKADTESTSEGTTEVQTVDPEALDTLLDEDYTFSPEESSILAEYGITENISDIIETDDEPVTLAIDGPIQGEEKEVKVKLDENGNPVSQGKSVKEIISGGTFTIDATVQSGDGTTVPLVWSAKDGKFLISTKLPVSETQNIRAKILNDGKNIYMLIPAMRMYMQCGEGMMGDVLPDLDEVTAENSYDNTTEVKVGKDTYICHHYTAEDGTITRYYYLGDQLKRWEITVPAAEEGGEDDTTVIEINSITEKVNDSDFKLPTAYIDMSSLMGEDFDVSSLA